MSKAFFRTVGDELSAAAKVAKGDIAGVATAAKADEAGGKVDADALGQQARWLTLFEAQLV